MSLMQIFGLTDQSFASKQEDPNPNQAEDELFATLAIIRHSRSMSRRQKVGARDGAILLWQNKRGSIPDDVQVMLGEGM